MPSRDSAMLRSDTIIAIVSFRITCARFRLVFVAGDLLIVDLALFWNFDEDKKDEGSQIAEEE